MSMPCSNPPPGLRLAAAKGQAALEGGEGRGREEVIECNQIWKVCRVWVGVGRHTSPGSPEAQGGL